MEAPLPTRLHLSPASVTFTVTFLGHPLPPRCSSAVRNGLLLLNLLLCNHHTLGDQIITQELRDTLFRHSGVAPGTEPMPTTRTVLTMLLSRYSEPQGSPERAGTMMGMCHTEQEVKVYILVPNQRIQRFSGNEGTLSAQARVFSQGREV